MLDDPEPDRELTAAQPHEAAAQPHAAPGGIEVVHPSTVDAPVVTGASTTTSAEIADRGRPQHDGGDPPDTTDMGAVGDDGQVFGG